MQLPIARYHFECVATDDIHLPFYSGSAMRGAFGYMLRKVSCMTRQPRCEGCPLRRTCPYSQVFEPEAQLNSGLSTEQTPPAYVLEPVQIGQRDIKQGESFQFSLVLIGDARQQLALIIFVWEQILAQGLRKSDGKAKLLSVKWQQDDITFVTVYAPGQPLIPHEAMLSIPEAPALPFLTIDLLTPTSIRTDGARLGSKALHVDDFLRAINRRYRLLMRQYNLPEFSRPDEIPTALEHEYREIHWLDWRRYSSRQEQEMTFGGLVGVWQWSFSDVKAWWPYLYSGQWFHIGKNAGFGMGHYKLSPTNQIMLNQAGEPYQLSHGLMEPRQ